MTSWSVRLGRQRSEQIRCVKFVVHSLAAIVTVVEPDYLALEHRTVLRPADHLAAVGNERPCSRLIRRIGPDEHRLAHYCAGYDAKHFSQCFREVHITPPTLLK